MWYRYRRLRSNTRFRYSGRATYQAVFSATSGPARSCIAKPARMRCQTSSCATVRSTRGSAGAAASSSRCPSKGGRRVASSGFANAWLALALRAASGSSRKPSTGESGRAWRAGRIRRAIPGASCPGCEAQAASSSVAASRQNRTPVTTTRIRASSHRTAGVYPATRTCFSSPGWRRTPAPGRRCGRRGTCWPIRPRPARRSAGTDWWRAPRRGSKAAWGGRRRAGAARAPRARRARRCPDRPRARSGCWRACIHARNRPCVSSGSAASFDNDSSICAGVPSNTRPQPQANSVSPQKREPKP